MAQSAAARLGNTLIRIRNHRQSALQRLPKSVARRCRSSYLFSLSLPSPLRGRATRLPGPSFTSLFSLGNVAELRIYGRRFALEDTRQLHCVQVRLFATVFLENLSGGKISHYLHFCTFYVDPFQMETVQFIFTPWIESCAETVERELAELQSAHFIVHLLLDKELFVWSGVELGFTWNIAGNGFFLSFGDVEIFGSRQ